MTKNFKSKSNQPGLAKGKRFCSYDNSWRRIPNKQIVKSFPSPWSFFFHYLRQEKSRKSLDRFCWSRSEILETLLGVTNEGLSIKNRLINWLSMTDENVFSIGMFFLNFEKYCYGIFGLLKKLILFFIFECSLVK